MNKITKLSESFYKWNVKIQKTISQIAEEKQIEIPVLYQIILSMKDNLESFSPELKKAEHLSKKFKNNEFVICSNKKSKISTIKTRCVLCNKKIFYSKHDSKELKKLEKICPECFFEITHKL